MTPPPSALANVAGSPRQEMAAASSICQVSPTRCQARTRLYRADSLEDDLAVLSEEFGLHPLARR